MSPIPGGRRAPPAEATTFGPTASTSLCAYTGSALTTPCSPENRSAGASADITTVLTIPSGDSNFRQIVTFVPPESAVAAGSSLPLGAVAGRMVWGPTLGMGNSACDTILYAPFYLMNATTNTALTVSPLPTSPTVIGGEGIMEPLRDDTAGGSPANSLPAHVDRYPSYLNTLFDPDGAGGTPALTPLARYSGSIDIDGRAWVFQWVLFTPGALTVFNPLATSDLGYPAVLVIQDPTATTPDPRVGAGLAISDTCSPLAVRTVLWGRTRDNPCTGGVCANDDTTCATSTPCSSRNLCINLNSFSCPVVDSGSGSCSGADEAGCYRYANPPSPGTYNWNSYLESLYDADSDGIENNFDTCPYASAPGYDPRDPMGDPSEDPDGDGIPGKDAGGNTLLAGTGCDPLPLTGGSNHDGDFDPDGVGAWSNRGDNCPLAANASQLDSDLDGIGDACDLSASTADGHTHWSLIANPKLITAAGDSDGDTIVDAVETDCGSVPADPGSIPERIDGAFENVDDDGNDGADEPLPPGSDDSDCDGDGFTGAAEAHVYATGASTAPDQDPCGVNALPPTDPPSPTTGWPSDLHPGDMILNSVNKVTAQDLTSFLAPVRYLDSDVGDIPGNVRWDLIPGPGVLGTDINAQDYQALIAGATANPPMLGGVRALDGPDCPWPP